MTTKLEIYNRTSQFKQNHPLKSKQKRLFDELEGIKRDAVIPHAEEIGILEVISGTTLCGTIQVQNC